MYKIHPRAAFLKVELIIASFFILLPFTLIASKYSPLYRAINLSPILGINELPISSSFQIQQIQEYSCRLYLRIWICLGSSILRKWIDSAGSPSYSGNRLKETSIAYQSIQYKTFIEFLISQCSQATISDTFKRKTNDLQKPYVTKKSKNPPYKFLISRETKIFCLVKHNLFENNSYSKLLIWTNLWLHTKTFTRKTINMVK